MPRTQFIPQNKAEVQGDFPRLKLDLNEKARIVCIEDPVYVYTHTLRAPKIVNGVAEKHFMERKDGSRYETFKLDFIGRPQCLGDLGILQDKGIDPVNCPACAVAQSSDLVDTPQRRFAMHVVKYATRSGTFELSNPYSVGIVVWSFTDTIFNKLTDFVTEWGPLAKHDLMLGPCTNKDYQKFDIAIAKEAAYLIPDPDKSTDRKRLTALAFKENQTKDLESFCGRRVERKWLEEDLEAKVKARWRIANGEPQVPDRGTPEAKTLAEGLDDLLNVTSETTTVEEEEAPAVESLVASAGESKPAESFMSFDDLLSGLGD